MTTITVSTTAGLEAALSSAHAGDTVLLNPGTYANFTLQGANFAQNVTVTSANSANEAVLTGMQVSASSGLNFSNLEVVGSGLSPAYYANVTNSSNVNFSNMLFEGSDHTAVNDAGGLDLQYDKNVSVTNSTFEALGTSALSEGSNNGVTISGNTFFNMGDDAIDNAGTSNVVISNNSFSDFFTSAGEHPDAIQFWTEGTTTSAQNITISDNVYTRGTGVTVQGIFVQDDGGTLPYEGLQITNNTIMGAGYNGIYVQGSTDAVISGNKVQGYTDYQDWIRVMNSTDPTLANNAAGTYVLTENNTGLTQTGDTTLNQAPPPAPILGNPGSAASYLAAGAAVAVANQMTVADGGNTVLSSASVVIKSGFLAGDTLSFSNQNGIAGSYDASTGVLTLTGMASLAAYQAALESVTFSSSAADPTQGGADLGRTLGFTVNDGLNDSNTASAAIKVTAPPPPATMATGPAGISPALAMLEHGATTLTAANVSITGGFLAGDALNFTSQNGITGSYNASTGVLTLSGSASAAAYETAMESITLSSTAADPTQGATDSSRAISFSVTGSGSSSSSVLLQYVFDQSAATPNAASAAAKATIATATAATASSASSTVNISASTRHEGGRVAMAAAQLPQASGAHAGELNQTLTAIKSLGNASANILAGTHILAVAGANQADVGLTAAARAAPSALALSEALGLSGLSHVSAATHATMGSPVSDGDLTIALAAFAHHQEDFVLQTIGIHGFADSHLPFG